MPAAKSAAEIFQSLTTTATDMKSAGAGSLRIRRAKNVECIKCRGTSFSVDVTYEYPEDTEELKELGTAETGNAFTWIWVTLKCRACGTV